MRVEVYKTNEIRQEYWSEIIFEFNRAFNVNKKIDELVSLYKRTPLGFSYHAIAFDDTKIIGYNAIYPYRYFDREGDEVLIGISGGTFVITEYRKEIFIFYDIVKALWEYIARDGFVATLGVSNENSYQYARRFIDAKLISYLPYYVLPVRIFNVLQSKKISFLNFISHSGAYIHLYLNLILSYFIKSSEIPSRYELKSDENFYQVRFSKEIYRMISSKNIKAYYRIVSENGIRSAYLFDFRENDERTYRALVRSTHYILSNEKPDIIIFIGYLRLRQYLLIRVPRRLEPQHLPLTFNITSPSFNQYLDPMSKSSNWNFGLMNFDVR
jgi:hypothetical protein